MRTTLGASSGGVGRGGHQGSESRQSLPIFPRNSGGVTCRLLTPRRPYNLALRGDADTLPSARPPGQGSRPESTSPGCMIMGQFILDLDLPEGDLEASGICHSI